MNTNKKKNPFKDVFFYFILGMICVGLILIASIVTGLTNYINAHAYAEPANIAALEDNNTNTNTNKYNYNQDIITLEEDELIELSDAEKIVRALHVILDVENLEIQNYNIQKLEEVLTHNFTGPDYDIDVRYNEKDNRIGISIAIEDKEDKNKGKGGDDNKTKPIKCKSYEQLVKGKCEPMYCLDVDGPIGPGGCPIPVSPCMNLYGKECCGTPEFDGKGECYDEGDFDDCEEGFVDKGFGCEPEENEEEPEVLVEEEIKPVINEEIVEEEED